MTKKEARALINRLPRIKKGDWSFRYRYGQKAVYFLYRATKLIYIGRSTQLAHRLNCPHHLQKNYTHFRYFLLRDFYDHCSVELFLIKLFRPEFNAIGYDGIDEKFKSQIERYLTTKK